MLRKSTIKQNNLLRVYMKLEQQSYSGQMGFRNIEEGGRVKEHLGGNEKTRKTEVFSAGYVLQTTVQSKLSDPFSVVPNAYTFTECIFLVVHVLFSFENTAYQNGRIQWRKM